MLFLLQCHEVMFDMTVLSEKWNSLLSKEERHVACQRGACGPLDGRTAWPKYYLIVYPIHFKRVSSSNAACGWSKEESYRGMLLDDGDRTIVHAKVAYFLFYYKCARLQS